MIHHGPEKQPILGAKGGVAIILSKEWNDLWKKGGCITRKRTILIGETTRILGIDIPIPNNKKNKDGKNKKGKIITIMTTYHPHSGYNDEETNAFNQQVAKTYEDIPKNNIIIIGSDINASIGRRENNKNNNNDDDNANEDFHIDLLLGPCGNRRVNHKGELFRNLLQQLDLRAISTYFSDPNGHDTWINPADNSKFQLDHFFTPRSSYKYIKSVKKKHYGAPSDHLPLLLTLKIDNGKRVRIKLRKRRISK